VANEHDESKGRQSHEHDEGELQSQAEISQHRLSSLLFSPARKLSKQWRCCIVVVARG